MSHERFAKSFYTVVNPNTRFAYEQEHCLLFGIVNFQSEHMSNILFVSSDDLTTIKFDHTTQENTRNSGSIEMKVSDNSESLEYLTQENIGSFADNIPCVELEKFWKQNKLSLYEFEKIRIGAQQIEYRMPVWKYVNWSDTNKEKITNLVLRLPSKREWIERWLTNKILGKLVVGDFKRFKDTEIAKYIADHEETIVDNGGLIFNRQKLNQYGDDKQEIPKLVRVLSKKIGINEQDIYDEMRRYLEEEYDETDFTDDEEDFEVIVEQKAIYALTPFDTNIVLNRE
eukprot:719998_1